jgi:5'-methylthioadenosine phosphorylase
VGSLREHIAPGHVVVPDQFIDRTSRRIGTFFGDGVVAHVQMGDPVDAGLRARLLAAARSEAATVHDGGTCVVMEGPAFSSRAESELYRSWGASVIGMTALPEAKLAREAEIAYAMLALSTDYDCWHVSEAQVSVEAVIAVLRGRTSRCRGGSCGPWRRRCRAAPPSCPTRGRSSMPSSPPPRRSRRPLAPGLDLILGHVLGA